MARDLNQCNFIGRIGKDLEVRFMPSGKAVLNFSIACGDDYKNKDGQKVEKTNWVNVVAFDRLAEVVGEHCKKGSKLFITGKFTVRKWQDQDGQDRYTTEIVAREMQMLDSRGEGQSGGNDNGFSQKQSTASIPDSMPPDPSNDFDDDIPF